MLSNEQGDFAVPCVLRVSNLVSETPESGDNLSRIASVLLQKLFYCIYIDRHVLNDSRHFSRILTQAISWYQLHVAFLYNDPKPQRLYGCTMDIIGGVNYPLSDSGQLTVKLSNYQTVHCRLNFDCQTITNCLRRKYVEWLQKICVIDS